MSAVQSYVNAATCSSARRIYRRSPERTAFYRLVQQHLETWLARRREGDCEGIPIPDHVARELRGYLEVRDSGLRLRLRPLQRLRRRLPGRLLLQGPRDVPVLHDPAHSRNRRAPG
jgi:hypothetical protein